MILSFHPCYEADRFINRAGRPPAESDIAAMKEAEAVILPQGCRRSLYEAACNNCPHVFPNYDAKFDYPRKTGQIRLFRDTGTAHPETAIFPDTAAYFKSGRDETFPLVFKFAWGDQGDNVFYIESNAELRNILDKALLYEKTGQKGFLIQKFMPCGNRSLRVAVIGTGFHAYWRVGERGENVTAVSKGSAIDAESDPELRGMGISAARKFCEKTGINLAGFDFIFPFEDENPVPFMLEINYFFGRRGLGGSERYYEILAGEIDQWLLSIGLRAPMK